MPEGDTLHTLAGLLRPLLAGRPLQAVRVRGQDRPDLAGAVVGAVEAVGKHLLLTAGERTLRVHLGLHGSWHRYRPGERWQRSPAGAGLVLELADLVLVCFRPSAVQVLRTRDRAATPALARLGPDLVAPDCDLAAVLARARDERHAAREVAALLLDQSVAAGIGNVYKSEVLFLEGVDPWTPVRAVPDETLRRLYERAAELLRANVGTFRRTTTGAARAAGAGTGRLWVYGRPGRGWPPLRDAGARGVPGRPDPAPDVLVPALPAGARPGSAGLTGSAGLPAGMAGRADLQEAVELSERRAGALGAPAFRPALLGVRAFRLAPAAPRRNRRKDARLPDAPGTAAGPPPGACRAGRAGVRWVAFCGGDRCPQLPRASGAWGALWDGFPSRRRSSPVAA